MEPRLAWRLLVLPCKLWMTQVYTEYESVVTVGLVEATVHAMNYRV